LKFGTKPGAFEGLGRNKGLEIELLQILSGTQGLTFFLAAACIAFDREKEGHEPLGVAIIGSILARQ
jgi:hypothetical protein